MRFRLKCILANEMHTGFILFDDTGANCGQVVILTKDLKDFISRSHWNGPIDWNNLMPHGLGAIRE